MLKQSADNLQIVVVLFWLNVTSVLSRVTARLAAQIVRVLQATTMAQNHSMSNCFPIIVSIVVARPACVCCFCSCCCYCCAAYRYLN